MADAINDVTTWLLAVIAIVPFVAMIGIGLALAHEERQERHARPLPPLERHDSPSRS